MYRDEDDLQLLAEVAGVLDQVVLATGLSPGSYLLLRELVANPDGRTITQLAESFEAAPDDVVSAAHALSTAGISAVEGTGVVATGIGRQLFEKIETDANAAIRDYVLERPHTATVYGLVASMQSGRFTVTDLMEFLMEPEDEDDEA